MKRIPLAEAERRSRVGTQVKTLDDFLKEAHRRYHNYLERMKAEAEQEREIDELLDACGYGVTRSQLGNAT
jgi:hypothetical protein